MRTNRVFGIAAAVAAMLIASPAWAGLDSRTSSPGSAYGDASGGSPASIIDTMVVAGSPISSIATLTVELNIDHEWAGDHSPVTLTKVGGPSITLFAQPGSAVFVNGGGDSSDLCSTNPILLTDTAVDAAETMGLLEFGGECIGDFGPSTFFASNQAGVFQSLDATFAGVDFNGSWELSIVDAFPAYTGGVLNSWTISVTPEPTTLVLCGLGALALIRRRR